MHGACILLFIVCTCDTRTYRACILSFTICTCDAHTYHGHRVLSFTVRTRVTLIHTITYCQCGARLIIVPNGYLTPSQDYVLQRGTPYYVKLKSRLSAI